MAKKRRWPWVLGAVVLVALAAGATAFVVRDPLLLPGAHDVEVYAVNDDISTEVDDPPGWFGRLLGLCDADTHYAQAGGKHLCLVLNGPLGSVRASRRDGRITLEADATRKLQQLAAQDTGTPKATTRLVLMSGKPAAVIPVTDLATGTAMSVAAL
jgi:hypothetical protein